MKTSVAVDDFTLGMAMLPINAEVVCAVDSRRLYQRVRQRHKRLPHQENTERAAQEIAQPKRGVSIHKSQLGVDHIVRNHGDQAGQHGGHQLQHKKAVASFKRDLRIGIASQRAREKRADTGDGCDLYGVKKVRPIRYLFEKELKSFQGRLLRDPLNGETIHSGLGFERSGYHPDKGDNP